jgi:hypothetical protein
MTISLQIHTKTPSKLKCCDKKFALITRCVNVHLNDWEIEILCKLGLGFREYREKNWVAVL